MWGNAEVSCSTEICVTSLPISGCAASPLQSQNGRIEYEMTLYRAGESLVVCPLATVRHYTEGGHKIQVCSDEVYTVLQNGSQSLFLNQTEKKFAVMTVDYCLV